MNQVIQTLPSVIQGLSTTMLVFGITALLSIPLGMIVAIVRTSKYKSLSIIIQIYTWVMRGTPLLLQLMLIFFGLPYIGLVFGRYEAALLAFILNYTAYYGEIFRGGIASIDKGQQEAASVLGLSKIYSFWTIIIPQVIKTTLPSLGNEIITLVKDTSLLYVLGIGELLRAGKIAANTYGSLLPFVLVAVVYLIVTALLTNILGYIEHKYSYYS